MAILDIRFSNNKSDLKAFEALENIKNHTNAMTYKEAIKSLIFEKERKLKRK